MSQIVPEIKLQGVSSYSGQLNLTGHMCNAYAPFQNLSDIETQTLGDFTTNLLNFDLQHPVDIIPQESYDGAVNLIINDGKNTPRLVNSRFSVIDDGRFKIPDHTGHKDTNIYDENTFAIDTALKPISISIPNLEFKGLTQFGGTLPCGSYTFYFKLADADGNESEVIVESGIVQVFIDGLTKNGDPDPKSARMGLQDENSGKSVSFLLSNIDTGYDYVRVLYVRSSSGEDLAEIENYHKVVFDYPITNDGKSFITITGKEDIQGVSSGEIYTDFADINSVKTQAIANNVLFFGNVSKTEHDWDALRRASWKILPRVGLKANVGSIIQNYNCDGSTSENRGAYYNPYNVYYRVGYWPDEIYRFGIVYIFNDNSLSPVFNLQGIDFTKKENPEITDFMDKDLSGSPIDWEVEQDDFYFNKKYRLNSKGVIKFPKLPPYSLSGGVLKPKPIYILFDLSTIGYAHEEKNRFETKDFFEKHKIKGFFFVRQNRIPTIISQGIAIMTTGKDYGAIPALKGSSRILTQSFLLEDLSISKFGTTIQIPSNHASVNGLLVPDAELSEDTFNLLFVSNKYTLNYFGNCSFIALNNNRESIYNCGITTSSSKKYKRKLTNIQDGIKTLTDGERYFSTTVGNASEPYKTEDVVYEWNKTAPQNLTTSTSLIRGNWGPFVGVGDNLDGDPGNLSYGSLYNIKLANYYDSEESAVDLDFQKRFTTQSAYHAICDRTQYTGENKIICYRGDCFVNLFTHRIMRNFIDPELPTNTKIIDPACWAKNYAVRNTALANVKLKPNWSKEDLGWYYDGENTLFANEIVQAFEVKDSTKDGAEGHWDEKIQEWVDEHGDPIRSSVHHNISEYLKEGEVKKLNKVNPQEQESSGIGSVIKNIFKSSKWELRGLSSINRADINAVGLGQWITFPICSNKNFAFRDVDFSNAIEQSLFNKKRSFYPLLELDVNNPLRDSNVINLAASRSIPHKNYYLLPDSIMFKQEYFTRIVNSLKDSSSSVTNEFKIMLESAYRDYTKVYGSITKLVPIESNILVVFQHGIGVLSITDSMIKAQSSEEYLPAELNMIVSHSFGSMWKDSILKTSDYTYGVDTVAKIIWRVSNQFLFIPISSMRVQKFLNENIEMSEFSISPYIGRINVKTHYNAFKHDVMFTYYNDVLYKFDSESYTPYDGVETQLSDFGIDSDGYLLDSDGIRIKINAGSDEEPNLIEVQGEKVVAEYNEETSYIDNYASVLSKPENAKLCKWATGKSWSLCWNELNEKFITFYDWIPSESENIDNIWFTFDREKVNDIVDTGVKAESEATIAPDGEGYCKDIRYSKHLIDPAFNSKCTINYFTKTNGKLNTFTFSSLPVKAHKLSVYGFYLYGITDDVVYTIKTDSMNLWYKYTNASIPDQEENVPKIEKGTWRFVVYKCYNSTALDTTFDITITCNTVNGAITNIIPKYVDENTDDVLINTNKISEWKSSLMTLKGNRDYICLCVPYITDGLDNYYFVRDLNNSVKLWKHGQAGLYDNADVIRPTYWYGKQHEFNFEFVVREDALHKIYNNLLIVSNKTEPEKFEVEVVGEAYEWSKIKPVLKWISDQINVPTSNIEYEAKLQDEYKYVLSTSYGDLINTHSDFPRIFGMLSNDYFNKLPYLKVTDAVVPTLDPEIIGDKSGEKNVNKLLKPELYDPKVGNAYSDNTTTTALVYDKQLNEYRVHTEQLGNDVYKYGRLRGNMQYLEDIWRVELRPVSFKYAYLDVDSVYRIDKDGTEHKGMSFTRLQEMRLRDKYCKVKVRYSGEDLAVIQSIITMFDYSLA